MLMVNSITKKQEIFAHVMKSIRKEYRISQTELARRLGRTQSYISKLERGTRGMEIFELMEYCQAMCISLTLFSARYELEVVRVLHSDRAHMKFIKEVLHSFNLTPLHKGGRKERKEE